MNTSGDQAMMPELADTEGDRRPRSERPGTPLAFRLVRCARAVLHIGWGLATTVFVFPWLAPPGRHALIRRWCVQFLRMLGVEPRVHWHYDGEMPANVLIVANHISWLDIFVLLSLKPARFIAKADLRRLPVVGLLIANVGTLFIERERRRDTHTVNRSTVEALTRGDIVAVFPEGTTSDGVGLLKFHSSLLQSAVDAQAHVQPIAIRYRTPAGEHCMAPAFVGDLTLFDSFWLVTGDREIVAELRVMPPFPAGGAHRRELSRAAEDAIRTALG